MINTKENQEIVFDRSEKQQTPTVKKLRFHPYYYQGRKGSYYNSDGKRTNIKIVKIEKNEQDLILTITVKLEDTRLELKSSWENIEFDYYSIRNTHWKIKFTKK